MRQHPVDLAGAEVGVEQQAGAFPPVLFESGLLPLAADLGGAAVLPDQGRPTGLAIAAPPKHRRFALIRDATAHDRAALVVAQPVVQINQSLVLTAPDRIRMLFHPAVRRVLDRQRRTGARHKLTGRGEDSGSRTAGSLVQCEEKRLVRHGRLFSSLLARGLQSEKVWQQ